ncbi:MAG: 30S ribosomal protein S18 [Pseudomonadota bacterium]
MSEKTSQDNEASSEPEKKNQFGRSGGTSRKIFFRRRKTCPFKGDASLIDYKDIKLLGRFISEGGKITPSRITAVSAQCQRKLSTSVKRARFLALIPYVNR